MASKTFRQEMPPPGGYGPIEWAKQVPKKRMSGFAQFGLFTGLTLAGWVAFYFAKKRRRRLELEMRDARIAIVPLVEAERMRLFLRQLRHNRDEENELMKDVQGWKTGTLWGEPVWYDIRHRWHTPATEEYFAHCKYWDKFYSVYDKMNH